MAIIRRRDEGGSITPRGAFDPFEIMRDFMNWDPFRELSRGLPAVRPAVFTPSFDVKERKDAYVFKADLPGVKEEDLDVELVGNRLTVSGKREEEQREEGETWFTYERSYGDFTRSFTLPEGVDTEHANAEMKDGVLTIVIPKKAEAQPKRIPLLRGKSDKDTAKA